jgi:UrcA family protein
LRRLITASPRFSSSDREIEGCEPMSCKFLIVAGAALAALGVAAGSEAAPPGETVSIVVKTADLDLSTKPGAFVALGRIKGAAIEICGGEPGIRLLGRRVEFNSCVAAIVNQTVAQVHSSVMTALNDAEHRRA